ncbi:hypothetical protein SAMN04488523_1269 [Sulfitobacter brevis]|uniref:Uncharacterized protein n=1 Tax=Sulfitobacter brevis TaxID=74348 RepID=A0A1I2GLZ6_9RHOB|nr:hypothetical protein [Sulfitobacter brevis]SFF18039.1 hypothetical protein SAMN04488523_1269 [Sulfitobacter brevis]
MKRLIAGIADELLRLRDELEGQTYWQAGLIVKVQRRCDTDLPDYESFVRNGSALNDEL